MTGSHSLNPDPSGPDRQEARTPRGPGRRTATVVTASVMALAAAAGSAVSWSRAKPPVRTGHAYGQEQLQRDVDAVRATGVVGVLGEADTGAGRLMARSGVADLTSRAPMPWDGHFRIGSATKTFTATVVLQLVGDRRLSLDDTVEKWLPGVVKDNGNDGRRITIRELLQHTSGLHDYLTRPAASPREWRQERLRTWRPGQLVARAMRHRPDFAPGTRWSYSNTNYVLAGMIIHKVTGHSWQWEIQRRILTPLNLRHTTTPGARPYVPDPHAEAYQRFAPNGPLTDVTIQNQTVGDAAGAMISTTGDLNRFFHALIGGRLLAPAQLAEMQRTVPAEEMRAMGAAGARYGLGLVYQPLSCGRGYWSHGGDADGYRTRMGVTSDGRRGVVVSVTSRSPADLRAEQRTDHALTTLVDDALCAGH
ncbi:serine hydrolase domain-containing protein [Actinoallomurus acaciae]|uniref:Serine hydrolase domain-containing protein n=1 Tax=Actinoallomurus acaciae TaxID=502577 RepID=A0ABV5YCG6_9ACTN